MGSLEEDEHHKRCTMMLEAGVIGNRKIHQLIDSIEELGCRIPKDFFACRPCTGEISGGFAVQRGKIDTGGNGASIDMIPQVVLCEDKRLDKETFENTIIHELVHAYDVCRARIDFSDCAQHACAEIRASTLSGECSLLHELWRGTPSHSVLQRSSARSSDTAGNSSAAANSVSSNGFILHGGMQSCVRRRAVKSVQMNPRCQQKLAEDAVDRVFEKCYRDCAPFKTED